MFVSALIMSGSARAEDGRSIPLDSSPASAPPLLPREAVLDTAPSIPIDPSMPYKLNGGVIRTNKLHGGQIGGQLIKPGEPNVGVNVPTMSTEQFRRLEHGVVGFHAVLRLDAPGPIVTEVLPTCPAAEAGMQPGDVLVKSRRPCF